MLRYIAITSEKDRQAAGELEIVQRLVAAEQVRLEYVVAHVDAQRQPVGGRHPIAEAAADGEALVAGEVGAARARDEIQPAAERVFAPHERFARQNVVADRQVVVAELAIVVGQQFDVTRQLLEAGLAEFAAAVQTPSRKKSSVT